MFIKKNTTFLLLASISVAYPLISVDPAFSFSFERKIIAPDGDRRDSFGTGVGISGNTAIVGSLGDDDKDRDSGSAYLFDVTTGSLLHKLTSFDAEEFDFFGFSVGISGNTAIVGSLRDSSAYLFDVTTGSLLHKLTAFDGEEFDRFGYSVGISGNTAIVGSHEDNDNGSGSGSAYLFDVTTGSLLHKLTAFDGEEFDFFGFSVGISGNTAIVGSPLDDDNGSSSGSAYLFDVTTGSLLNKLTAFDGFFPDVFGDSVGISGNTAIVGSPLGDSDNGFNSGSAYLFDVTTGNLLHKLTAFDGEEFDRFGDSVGISGNTAIVGSSLDDDNASGSGSAYLFDVTTGSLLHKLTAFNGEKFDRFGDSVGISGNKAIVGSSLDDNDNGRNSGSAYIYSQQEVEKVPEPLTILGTLTALGFGTAFKRKKDNSKN